MLPDFRLETYFSRWEFTARYHLCASDMESMSVNALLELADDDGRQQWDALRLGYTETFGAPDLRTAIAALPRGVADSNINLSESGGINSLSTATAAAQSTVSATASSLGTSLAAMRVQKS